MKHPEQVALLKQLLHYLDTGTTAMAPAPWRNEVTCFTDPARFERERAMLFRTQPLFIGFASEWAKPGDYKTEGHAGVPILIVRGRDGVLRGFLNVCRHRGAKVVDGCGAAKAFSCPYHAWSYDLAGRVTHVPEERYFPGVKAERAALVALPLCEKHGLVWVIPTPAAEGAASFDIDPWLGGLAEEFANYGFATWHHYETREIRERMNWKLVMDTFFEGYHIGFLHKNTLGPILHGNITAFTAYGANHRLTVPRRKLARLKDMPESEWDAMWYTTLLYSLFPNTVFIVQGDHVEVFRIFPDEDRIDATVMTLGFYVPKPVATEAERRHWNANMDLVTTVVQTEDFPAGRTMPLGFASGAQRELVYGRNEPAMIHWHHHARRALGLPIDAPAPQSAWAAAE
jgi:phenylpropionate dioxygenase-like ring-hydroxylating dioxygenase large terminal subunit